MFKFFRIILRISVYMVCAKATSFKSQHRETSDLSDASRLLPSWYLSEGFLHKGSFIDLAVVKDFAACQTIKIYILLSKVNLILQ